MAFHMKKKRSFTASPPLIHKQTQKTAKERLRLREKKRRRRGGGEGEEEGRRRNSYKLNLLIDNWACFRF